MRKTLTKDTWCYRDKYGKFVKLTLRHRLILIIFGLNGEMPDGSQYFFKRFKFMEKFIKPKKHR